MTKLTHKIMIVKENPNVSIKYRNLNELQDCVVLQSYTKTESNSHTEK